MKRLAFITALLMLLTALTACGGNNSATTSAQDETDPPQITSSADTTVADDTTDAGEFTQPLKSVKDLISEGSTIISKLSPEQQAETIRQAKDEGIKIEINADGSTLITYEDGTSAIQDADGNWSWKDENGGSGELLVTGGWPENEYTALLPEYDASPVDIAASEGGVYSMVITGGTYEAAKAYGASLREAGFTVDAEESDLGETAYIYTAKNSDGATVEFGYTTGVGSVISITIPG